MDKTAGGNGLTHFKNAKAGNIFLVTEKGYEKTPDEVKKERNVLNVGIAEYSGK